MLAPATDYVIANDGGIASLWVLGRTRRTVKSTQGGNGIESKASYDSTDLVRMAADWNVCDRALVGMMSLIALARAGHTVVATFVVQESHSDGDPHFHIGWVFQCAVDMICIQAANQHLAFLCCRVTDPPELDGGSVEACRRYVTNELKTGRDDRLWVFNGSNEDYGFIPHDQLPK